MSKMTPYIYVLVRKDIPIADQIVQVGHVCVEAGKKFQHPPDTHMVLLQVEDESALIDARHHLITNKIDSIVFWEPDDSMGETVLATETIYGEKRKHFKPFQLWRYDHGTEHRQSQYETSASGAALAEELGVSFSNSTPEKEEKIPDSSCGTFTRLTLGTRKSCN